jgi:hypothetical protein
MHVLDSIRKRYTNMHPQLQSSQTRSDYINNETDSIIGAISFSGFKDIQYVFD